MLKIFKVIWVQRKGEEFTSFLFFQIGMALLRLNTDVSDLKEATAKGLSTPREDMSHAENVTPL